MPHVIGISIKCPDLAAIATDISAQQGDLGLKKVKCLFPAPKEESKNRLYILQVRLLPLLYCMGALFRGLPGLSLHFRIMWLGVRLLFSKGIGSNAAMEIVSFPMDSVRYFEFDFVWRAVTSSESIGRYLDISSPRMFSLALMGKYNTMSADMVNPDAADLEDTKNIADALDLNGRCTFHNKLVDQLSFYESFDTIVSISVLEHIPGQEDHVAVRKIWEMLKPGGRLLVTMPCCREAYEEYYNINQYDLLSANEENMYFGQRFYDDTLLEQRIFSVTGKPVSYSIYGEKENGFFNSLIHRRLTEPYYPSWQEPYVMGNNFTHFKSISDLPGIGVIAMEFVKAIV